MLKSLSEMMESLTEAIKSITDSILGAFPSYPVEYSVNTYGDVPSQPQTTSPFITFLSSVPLG